jgi:flagellar biosynthesis GTPase FlhF
MYYPFLICEVKGSDRPIQEAERQSMHSASIAVQAIIQLYRKIDATDEVDRKILAFSVAHNNTTVKIFGHFARIEEQKLTFYRCRLYTADFATDFASDDWAKPYSIIRAIYDLFFPQHLTRITDALSRLRGRALESFTSQLGVEEDSQGSAASQPSSQERGAFKRPSLPSTSRMQQENDRLRDQLAGLLHEQQLQREQQMVESREQRSLMERQMVQQKAEAQEQKALMEWQITQQKEQMERELARQKEEARKQKLVMEQQVAQQKAEASAQKLMLERQMAQQTEIITLLKENKTR